MEAVPEAAAPGEHDYAARNRNRLCSGIGSRGAHASLVLGLHRPYAPLWIHQEILKATVLVGHHIVIDRLATAGEIFPGGAG